MSDRTDGRRHGNVVGATAPLTVLQVLPALEAGGVERGILEIARALVEAGHRSLVASAGGRLVNRLVQEGSEHIECHAGSKSLRCLLAVRQLRDVIVKERVDVLDVHSRLPAWVVCAALRGMPCESRPRLVSTFHGFYTVSRYSQIMGCGDRVVCVSDALRQHVQESYPLISRDILRVVRRGICHDEFPRGYRPTENWRLQFERDFPQARGRKILLLPGRVTRLKGHQEFIDLVAALRKVRDDVHAFIVGGVDVRKTEFAESLIHRQRQLGLSNHITWTGYRSDVRDFYAMSSLVFSMSRKPEAFGRTIAESLAVGTPVVAWDHGGAREILLRSFPVGLVPVNDADLLLQRVLQLLDDPDPLNVGDIPFHQSDMISGTLAVYSEMMNERVRRAA